MTGSNRPLIGSGLLAALPLRGFPEVLEMSIGVILGWGWLVIVAILLWAVWKIYMLLKRIDYVAAIQWTYLQVTIPEEAGQTPKAMENAYDVWDGIHKSPDLTEMYFDGYIEAWYSCELHCVKGKAKYIMVVPTAHKSFFEGVIYGQYPQAEVVEVEDYTQKYDYKDIDSKFDLYGTEMILVDDDIFPLKTFHDYEDKFNEDDTFVDPHQALVEAYTNIPENQEFWVQIVIRPIDAKDIAAWEQRGEDEINRLAGIEDKKELNLWGRFFHSVISLPIEMFKATFEGPLEADDGRRDSFKFPVSGAADQAKMDGILLKVSKGGYRCKIRILHLAPLGELHKPNISRAIGGFKQFNSFNLNSLKPDPDIKTNGPNYLFKKTRRYRRKRKIFLDYQWRDLWGYESGFMLSAEELATLYHFPIKYVKSPAVERAKSGLSGAPDNLPYAE